MGTKVRVVQRAGILGRIEKITHMLKKIIRIKNIGRFRNSAAVGDSQLSHHTLILGANGYGKTTLCAVLRSLKNNDPAHIAGRRTLGVEDPPTVELLFSDGVRCFDGTAWSAAYPALAIFDDVFVAQNVHSGETVEIDQRRNLYRVIIGEKGVSLAEEEANLARQGRRKTRDITEVTRAIQPRIPPGMTLDDFIVLPSDPEIDTRIREEEKTVEAIRQAKQLNDRPPLSKIVLPTLPDGFASLLARTIDDIAQDAETRLSEHIAKHSMGREGSNWIARGLEHADGETCPFCGQNVRGLLLIAAFRAVFSDRYKALRDDVTVMHNQITERFGEVTIGRLNAVVAANRGAVDFWSRYCTFDPVSVAISDDLSEAVRALRQAALAALERKDRAPLEPIRQPDAVFDSAAKAYEDAYARAQKVADAIDMVNSLIATKKEETGVADMQVAEAELARRRAVKVRHTDEVAGLCADYKRFSSDKNAIEQRKNEVRAQLEAHTNNVVKPYEKRINQYLEAFNAGFRITKTKHGFPGGTAASAYQLVINETAIDVGDGKTPPDRPSFKNTLSAGDRTTLALAFFLAPLQDDLASANKIVVFDDPFNSQDAYRRQQTVNEIVEVARRCAQVIVLSHDATFLKQVWDKAPAAERVTLNLADRRAQGSQILRGDLERACQGRTAKDIDDLQTYRTTGEGDPVDLIRKMRVVLETHCWTTYGASFQDGRDWPGEIVRKIREGGSQHPAWDLYTELEQINDYTTAYHHGEDVAKAPSNQIDQSELTGFVKRTLAVVNALQA